MKKVFFLVLFVMVSLLTNAQVFNTTDILEKGKISVGFEPAIFIQDGSDDFRSFFHGGYGLGNKIDLAVKISPLSNDRYYGADLEYGYNETLSFSIGAHHYSKFILDATVNYSIPLIADIKLTTGFDADYFTNNSRVAVWLPVGFSLDIKENLSAIMEFEFELTDEAYNFVGIGMAYEF